MKKAMIVTISIVLLFSYGGVWAKEETEEERIEAEIAFQLTVEDRYPYEIRVTKGGSVYDGSQRITNGIQEYQLSVGEEKTFRIEADTGYQVERITINGKSIDKDLEKITIAGVSTRSILEVVFEKKEEQGEIEEESKEEIYTALDPPDSTNRVMPITSDGLKLNQYLILMLVVMYQIYRNEYEKERGGKER